MTKDQQPLNPVFVRYEGTANFKFVEGEDFFDDEIESVRGRSESEDLIASACPEIDKFTITDAEYDGECLYANALISGSVLLSVPWHRSDAFRPDQIEHLLGRVISYISAGVSCVQSVKVDLKPENHGTLAAT